MEKDEFIAELANAVTWLQNNERKCMFKNYRLVKIKLPTFIVKELKKRCKKVVAVNTGDYFMGIPVEEDKNISRPQYVIEGDLEIIC